jgi:hypothetical protein
VASELASTIDAMPSDVRNWLTRCNPEGCNFPAAAEIISTATRASAVQQLRLILSYGGVKTKGRKRPLGGEVNRSQVLASYGQFRLLISRQFFGQGATPFRMAADRSGGVVSQSATCWSSDPSSTTPKRKVAARYSGNSCCRSTAHRVPYGGTHAELTARIISHGASEEARSCLTYRIHDQRPI